MSIKIDQAFINAIMTGGLALDIVHDGGAYSVWGGAAYVSKTGAYTPSTQVAYLEIKPFPAGTSSHDLNTTDEDVGLFQCIVRYPADGGSIAAVIKAEEVLALFKAGTNISYSGQVVNIVSNNRSGGSVIGGFYEIVVRANYRAFVAK